MSFNIFKGCRRLVWGIAALVTIIGTWFVVFPNRTPTITVAFKKGGQPQLVEKCPQNADSGIHHLYSWESPVAGAHLILCVGDRFRTSVKAGYSHEEIFQYLALKIPTTGSEPIYRSDPAENEKTRQERKAWAASFQAEAGAYIKEKNLEYRIGVAKYTAIALAVLFSFSWVIGWIMRGFLSIPRGADRRPPQ